jgi:sulfate transport system permease protein
MMSSGNRKVLPGFGLSLGYSMLYLSLLALIPLAACFLKAFSLTGAQFWAAVASRRALDAYKFSLVSSLTAAVASIVLGLLIAWVLVRYEFWGKRLVDSLVDLPFALPTAVAGLVYSSLYVPNGWLGRFLVPIGIKAAYTPLAVVLVLTFLGIPFVVRTIQPILESMDADTEEASFLLGATRLQTFTRVIFPPLVPALITGFALSLARGLGEYGSVVFVSGNMPYKTEIAPVLIVQRLEEFAYAEATAIAAVLLIISFTMLIIVNLLERWSSRVYG